MAASGLRGEGDRMGRMGRNGERWGGGLAANGAADARVDSKTAYRSVGTDIPTTVWADSI